MDGTPLAPDRDPGHAQHVGRIGARVEQMVLPPLRHLSAGPHPPPPLPPCFPSNSSRLGKGCHQIADVGLWCVHGWRMSGKLLNGNLSIANEFKKPVTSVAWKSVAAVIPWIA